MKIRKNHIHLFILLFAVSSLLVHSPSEAFAANGDIIAVKSQAEGNHFQFPGTTHLTETGSVTCTICSSLVQVDSDTYAYAYTGPNNRGHIQTFSISADGSSITAVDNVKHDHIKTTHSSLVKGEGDLYVLSHDSGDADSWMSTFTIDSDGEITPILIHNHEEFESASANLEHDTHNIRGSSLVHLDSDTYVLALEGHGYDGYIKTFTIPSDGSSITEVDEFEHDTMHAEHNSLVKVDSDTVALAYTGYDPVNRNYWGVISTFNIAANGNISERASIEHDDDSGYYNSLVKVNSDTYALAYAGSDQESGFIKTFTIPSDGSSITQVSSLEHDTNAVKWNSLVKVHSGIYALSYSVEHSGYHSDGFLSTFTIDGDGNIEGGKTQSQGNNLMHELDLARENILVAVNSNIVVLAYKGGQGTSYHRTSLSTFCIEGAPNSYTTCIPNVMESGSGDTRPIDELINPSPHLVDEILVSVGPNKAIVTQNDGISNIQIQKGDSITITLNVVDGGPIHQTNHYYGQSDIESVSLYTNFGSRPDTMNLYHANHFNDDREVSKTFYEWNANRDNVVYDFTKSVTWHNPVVRTASFDTTSDDSNTPAGNKLIITFYSTWNEVIPKSEILVKVADAMMGYSIITLPFTLQVGDYDPSFEDLFGHNTDYKFVPLVIDSNVRESIHQWVDPLSGMTDERFVSSLGLNGNELPEYVKHLAQWVVEDKIDLADLIIAVEYIINVK